MDHEDTIKLLTLIKGNWYRQPTDDLTMGMWQAILGEDIQLADVWIAAMRMIKEPKKEPPTPGELYAAAVPEMQARKVREQNSLIRIGDIPKWQPGERRVTGGGTVYVADETGTPRRVRE